MQLIDMGISPKGNGGGRQQGSDNGATEQGGCVTIYMIMSVIMCVVQNTARKNRKLLVTFLQKTLRDVCKNLQQ